MIIKNFIKLHAKISYRINSNQAKLIKPSVLFPAKKAVKHNPHLNDMDSVIKLKLQILELKTYPSTKQALITILYTATRPDETLGARWREFDFEKGYGIFQQNA